MFVPSSVISKDQECVCMYTGESYVHLDEEEVKNLTPEQKSQAIEILPERFFKHPRVFQGPNGEIRVYGIKV